MPSSSRKRARSDADGGRSARRRSRREEDGDANGSDNDDSRGEDSLAGPSNGGGMDVDDDGASSNAQSSWRLPAGYDDSNRAFLQALMAHGALTFQQAQQVLAPILNVKKNLEATAAGASPTEIQHLSPEDVTFDTLRHYINQAKAALVPLDFDIRSATNERSMGSGGSRGSGGQSSSTNSSSSNDRRVWVLVSTDKDPKSHLAVLFTPRKLAFIHRLLDALFDTYNTPRIEALCITEQQALKLSRPPRTAARPSVGGEADGAGAGAGAGADADGNAAAAAARDKGLKHSVVLSLLASLVRQGWLAKSAQGFYALTTRALLELEPFLVDQYNEEPTGTTATTWQRIKYCAACRELITSGLRCATPTCTLRLHDHCEEAFWRSQAARNTTTTTTNSNHRHRHRCPQCDAPWGKAEDANGEVEGKLHFIGERAITSTDVYRRKKRQGRPSEGVDELMRTLQPRAATGGSGRGRTGGGEDEVAAPFRQAASRRREVAADGEDE
ncbi:DNA repair protein Nse1 [Sporothrix schenckii 1099-18]|uniref:Non-structural maintenance of chromosomes element 1 homolog n=2 Tax=Sporothrix schenckii TaxID=29908 RepID=U7Q5W0_SPOS1|nr:DNA repair protein Nse1 [Sporothrix schenckii 1099-18]ERT02567.1 hypothetical protein HMPREF1624_00867 [Sporothrix schenckii ATCC 58251]KJR80143.1 DNA repair protein Nse1 [Sporothrix schenckii 1099-18]